MHYPGVIMSGGLDDREKAYEDRWAHDEELRFKVHVRRAKLVGLWAADQMGLSGAEAEAYAKTLVATDLTEHGDEDVFAKVRSDFDAKGIARSDHLIRTRMAELLETAKHQVMTEV